MLNVRHLAVFRAVMQVGTVSGAARMLNVSQPALTKSLQLIEEHLGVILFERIKGRLHPTPDAEALMPEVDRLFGSMRTIENLADQIRRGHVGRLSIAAVPTMAATVLPAVVSEFSRDRGRVSIEILALPTRAVVHEVSNNHVDLGLVDVPSGSGYFESIELCRAQLACVVKRDSPFAGREALTPADLKEQRLISYSDETLTGWMLRDAFRLARIEMPLFLVTNQTIVACEMVRRDVGIAIVDPFPLILDAPEDLAVVPFVPSIEIRPTAILPPDRPPAMITDHFLKALKTMMDSVVARSPLLKAV